MSLTLSIGHTNGCFSTVNEMRLFAAQRVYVDTAYTQIPGQCGTVAPFYYLPTQTVCAYVKAVVAL